MPIAFKDVDVARLEWTTQLENNTNGQKSETFQLDRFQHTACNPYFKVSCTYSFIGDAVKDRAELHFTLVEQPLIVINGQIHCGGRDGSISNYRPRPRSIWVRFNDRSVPLIESSANRSGEWNSAEKLIVDLVNDSRPGLNRSLQFTCLFYIEFKTFGLREANAVKHLAELFAKQTDCDVQFCFPESRLEIGGHVYVLASRSHVFAAAFQKETPPSAEMPGQVLVEDIEPSVFKEMLHYIYSGKTSSPLTEDMAKPLFLAAATYAISDLEKECADCLLRSINLKNAINLMIWAHLNSVEDVEEAALSYAARHGRKIVFQEDFEKLIRNYPELCLVTTRRMIDIISPLPRK